MARNPDFRFVNVVDDPSRGRDQRRLHVRRSVMNEYHKRKRQQKEEGGGQTAAAQAEPAAAAPVFQAQPQPAMPPLPRLPALSLAASASASASASHLLRAKTWNDDDAHLARTARLVTSFLCGQPAKAATRASDAAFVHWRAREAGFLGSGSAGGGRGDENDALGHCLRLLRACGRHDGCDGGDLRRVPPGRAGGDDGCEGGLWRGIGAHQEDIYTQCPGWNAWELLSSAQSLSLYLLLRLKRGDNHAVLERGDVALLFTLRKVFKTLQARHLDGLACHLASPAAAGWDAWIFHESVMRTAMVYFLLTLVADTEFGIGCDEPDDWGIDELPVPAARAAWTAWDDSSWRESLQSAGTPLVFGHLVRAEAGGRQGGDAGSDGGRVGAWLETVDEMGLVVAMAAQLASGRIAG